MELLNQMATVVDKYGWATFIGLLIISGLVYNRKAIVTGLMDTFSGSIKSVIYEERIAKLEEESISERASCEEKMNAMRKDYEDKMKALDAKIEAMVETIRQQSEDIGSLRADLKNAQEKALKFYKKAGTSIKPQ